MASTHLYSLLALLVSVQAADLTFPDPTINGSNVPTKVYDVTAASTAIVYTYSNEELGLLWDQIGPIAVGPITSTVKPTPEPTSYARPGLYHPMVPTYDTGLNNATLPEDFMWGVATSAFQVEGAAKDEGKGPSIWDLLTHREAAAISDNTTADIAASQYYLYKQDTARMANLGIPYYNPSFAWSRFFPFGAAGSPVNEQAVAHYDDVIQSLVDAGIKPVVTLFHWDTPLALFNSYGAWTDPKIVDDFFNYATYVIQRYDAYVPVWYTFNEPQYCNWGYANYKAGNKNGLYPAYHNLTTGIDVRFTCGHYILLAHARVAKWYHEEFKGKGRISFKNSGNYFQAADPSSIGDTDAVARGFAFTLGWFGGPWTDGDYPTILKDTLGDTLPSFTEEEKDMIKGSCDFYAIDGYTGYIASAVSGGSSACASDPKNSNYPECISQANSDNSFPVGPTGDYDVSSWLYSTPIAIRSFLNTITKTLFPNVTDIVVSEFGFAEPFEEEMREKTGKLNTVLWDLRRADYYQGFLDNILAARIVDGVNVTGAFAWALYDNFEWFQGSREKFGLQYLNSETMERTPKASMFQFLDWFALHGGANLTSQNPSAGGRNGDIPNTTPNLRAQG